MKYLLTKIKIIMRPLVAIVGVLLVIISNSALVFAQTAPLTRDQSANYPWLGAPGCNSSAPSTSESTGGTVSGTVFMVGDSITNGSKDKLETTLKNKGFSEATINARDGRTLSEGIDILKSGKDSYKDASTVIVALGTNGGLTADSIKSTIDAVTNDDSTPPKILWVNIGVDNSKRDGPDIDGAGLNKILADNTSAGYSVIDWGAQVAEHPDYIDPNPTTGLGVHPINPAGTQAFADTVSNGVSGGSASPQGAGQCVCGGTGGSKTSFDIDGLPKSLVGETNEQQVFNFFNEVFPGQPWIGAGFIGNMTHESGLNPRALEPGTTGDAPIRGRGYGLVQWTFAERQKPLEDMASERGVPVYDMLLQLHYVMWELENKFQTTIERLQNLSNEPLPEGKSISDKATEIIEIYYETHQGISPQGIRDGIETSPPHNFQQDRKNVAARIMTEMGSNTGGSSGSVGCSNENGLVSGEFSLPTDKAAYDQYKATFLAPHHDYPAADIGVPTGTPIFSMTSGKIISAPTGDDCGVGVEIEYKPGIRFIYCHGSDGGSIPGASQGDSVKPGQLIMHSASTGHSTGPHLHLGIRIDDVNVCPQTLFTGIAEGNVPDLKSLPTGGCTN